MIAQNLIKSAHSFKFTERWRNNLKIAEYKNGKVIYRDMTEEEVAEYQSIPNIPQEPTQEDRIEAQVLYTALMTDTLLEG